MLLSSFKVERYQGKALFFSSFAGIRTQILHVKSQSLHRYAQPDHSLFGGNVSSQCTVILLAIVRLESLVQKYRPISYLPHVVNSVR